MKKRVTTYFDGNVLCKDDSVWFLNDRIFADGEAKVISIHRNNSATIAGYDRRNVLTATRIYFDVYGNPIDYEHYGKMFHSEPHSRIIHPKFEVKNVHTYDRVYVASVNKLCVVHGVSARQITVSVENTDVAYNLDGTCRKSGLRDLYNSKSDYNSVHTHYYGARSFIRKTPKNYWIILDGAFPHSNGTYKVFKSPHTAKRANIGTPIKIKHVIDELVITK